jgi:MerR family transcriptional regulator, thiopeptide resistance regulator
MRDATGNAVHGEVRAGGATIWLHRVTPEHGLAVADNQSSDLVIYVDDVDVHFTHARSAGARIDAEPVDQPYGQREYGARDPEGHRWWFATPVTPQGVA